MIVHTIAVFIAASYMAVASASISAEAEAAINSPTGNGNFIIQLNDNTCINDFVPEFIDHAYEVTDESIKENLVKRLNRIVHRDTEEEHVHIFDAYNIGSNFKAIGVAFKDYSIIKAVLERLGDQVISIAADRTIQFDLPTLNTSSAKRHLSRRAQTERNSNLDIQSLGKGCINGDNNYAFLNRAEDIASAEPVASVQAIDIQQNAQWNLVRISQRRPSGPNNSYVYSASAGSSAFVYIIDDGLRADHVDFGGRASLGYNAYAEDDRFGTGHGTHVAGIVGSSTYGVAKKATLIGVKVLDRTGHGNISTILSGLQFVSNDAVNRIGKAIINMSFGLYTDEGLDSSYASFNNALDSLVRSGIPIFASAGNGNRSTCDFLPSSNPNVYAVGSSDRNNQMSSISNYGDCTNIIAPGQNIRSTFSESADSTSIYSGTSMASPHVAGVAALFVDAFGKPKPDALYKAITSASTKNVINPIKIDTPNYLVYNNPA